MYFSKLAVLLAAATSAQCALTFQKYNDFQISSGTAGNALEEAKAAFPVCYSFHSDYQKICFIY